MGDEESAAADVAYNVRCCRILCGTGESVAGFP
jgi:hypothetical protein